MKNDPFFKYVAATFIAGVFIALFSPGRPAAHTNDPAAQIAEVATAGVVAHPSEPTE